MNDIDDRLKQTDARRPIAIRSVRPSTIVETPIIAVSRTSLAQTQQ